MIVRSTLFFICVESVVMSPLSFLFLNLFIYLFIYLAALGLSCGRQDLCCSMWDLSLQCAGFSLVVAHRLQSARPQ